MNLRTLLREAVTAARTSPVPSALVLLVVAAMCFAAVATVGRQAATEAAVAAELSGPGARVLTVTDTGGTGFLTGATAMDDYSDEHSVCIELTESTYAMYLSPGYYTDFIGNREIADCLTTNSALMALTVGDAAAVDALADRAIELGAAEVPLPEDLREEMADSGMHSREIVDPDGHQWEFVTA